MNYEELWLAFVEPDEASFTIPCDGCGTETADPQPCEHFELCPDCRAEGCAKCRRIARDEIGATW